MAPVGSIITGQEGENIITNKVSNKIGFERHLEN
jgi:hypothetical protein